MQCSGLLCQTVTVAAEKCKYLESLVGAGAPGRPGLVGGGEGHSGSGFSSPACHLPLALWCPDCSPHHIHTADTRLGSYEEMLNTI